MAPSQQLDRRPWTKSESTTTLLFDYAIYGLLRIELRESLFISLLIAEYKYCDQFQYSLKFVWLVRFCDEDSSLESLELDRLDQAKPPTFCRRPDNTRDQSMTH